MFKDKYNSSMDKHNPSDELIERTRQLMKSPPKRSNKIVWKYAINISAACLLLVAVTVAYQLIPNNIELISSDDTTDGNGTMQNAAGAATPNETARAADNIASSSAAQQLLGEAIQSDNILNKIVIDDSIIKYSAIAYQQEQATLETTISTISDTYYVNELIDISYPAKKISADNSNIQAYELTEALIIENFGESFGFYIPDYITPQLPFSFEVTSMPTATETSTEILRCFSFDFAENLYVSPTRELSVRAYPVKFKETQAITAMMYADDGYYASSSISDIEVFLGVGIDSNNNSTIQMAEFIKGDMFYQVVSSNIFGEDFTKTLYTILLE